ncbi:hypothetical protein TNCV_2604471 [Trichonephila clavipes]|nr:hypothetical protein TNCV_2604471 [Trichonephila clavipes]
MNGHDEERSEERRMDFDAVGPTLDPELHCAYIRAQEKEIECNKARLSYLNDVLNIERLDSRDTCSKKLKHLAETIIKPPIFTPPIDNFSELPPAPVNKAIAVQSNPGTRAIKNPKNKHPRSNNEFISPTKYAKKTQNAKKE